MKILKFNFKKIIICLFIILLILALVLYPEKYLVSSKNGLLLWANAVLPSLLPFFFLTTILTKLNVLNNIFNKFNKVTNFLFNTSGITAYSFFISIISGYPVGSRTILELYENNLLDKDECMRASTFCSTSGPLFIIGVVGQVMYNSKKIGFLLLISHILSAIITGITFRFVGKKTTNKNKILNVKTDENILYSSIYSACLSIIIVGGFICVFYIASDVLVDTKILYPLQKLFSFILMPFTNNIEYSNYLSFGLIECTKGCKLLSTLSVSPLSLCITSFILSFGGLSAIFQSIIYLNKIGIKTSFFILSKSIQGIYSIIVSLIIFTVFL